MPTHWESSKRPLFVRTVLVNGSRHAILTQEDPLGQSIPTTTKTSRPSSAHSNSSSSAGSGQSATELPQLQKEPIAAEKGGKKCSRDLQACLVKLRLVLATQENRKAVKPGKKHEYEGNKKRKRTTKCNNSKKSCDWHEPTHESNVPEGTEENSELQPTYKYDDNHNITVASFFTSEPRFGHCCHQSLDENIERISGHADYPQSEIPSNNSTTSTLGIGPEYDVPWNSVSAETYFTRPFYNKLSERVLQWLDLANKKKVKPTENGENKTESKHQPKSAQGKDAKQVKRVITQRGSSEDNAEEVRVEEDVDTALSREFPKFSQQLNRLHYLKATIPVKREAYSAQLQESIAQSFTTIVSIRSGKYAEAPKVNPVPAKPQRKGHLTRQVRLDESSEEDGANNENVSIFNRQNRFLHRNSLFNKNLDTFGKQCSQDLHPLSNLSPQLQSKIPWLRDCKWPPEKETGKPQLHIFIPALPSESEPVSDSASICSDS